MVTLIIPEAAHLRQYSFSYSIYSILIQNSNGTKLRGNKQTADTCQHPWTLKKAMTQPLEHDSDRSSSQTDSEYHSKQETKSEEEQVIIVDYSKGHTFLDIWFPLPAQFPKPCLMLQEVTSNLDDTLPKPYEWTHDYVKDPKSALAYIITNFNIGKISRSIQDFPLYHYDQVYYSAYIDISWYTSLQCYIAIQAHNL